MRIIWGTFKRSAKEFAWLLPDGMQPDIGDLVLVQRANGVYAKIRVRRLAESDISPTGRVLQIIPPGQIMPCLEEQRIRSLAPGRRAMYEEIKRWESCGLDISPYRAFVKNYDTGAERLEMIRKSLHAGLPVQSYADPALPLRKARAIKRQQLLYVANLMQLIPLELRREQITQVLLGLDNGIDPAVYSNPAFGWRVMREVRLALESGMTDTKALKRLARKGRQAVRAARLQFLAEKEAAKAAALDG